ncbi:MAG: M56 family metallopeptidase [Bacteroidetes bacterium]|nr:M56 family metallopeptidase [Bacteroidota bacterium]MBL6944916.1 M56 family metallopeptidase [Bacteroidales bacterium]
MNSLILYIIQSSVSLLVFSIFYELLFKRDAYFVFNRYYLLFAIFISSLLPLVNFNFIQIFSTSSQTINIVSIYSLFEYTIGEVTIYGHGNEDVSFAGTESLTSYFGLIILIYFVGVFVSTASLVNKLYHLLKIFNKSKVVEQNGLHFIFTEKDTPAFSFFNYVFIDEDLFNSRGEGEKIIVHEMIHIKQKHSIDLLVAEIFAIIQWYNPLVYLLKKTLKENHEFIADSDVIAIYPDIISYTKLLINNSSIIKTNILTHNFSYSLLKRRLFMIKKSKNPLRFSLKLVLGLVGLSLVLFACSGPMQDDAVVENKKTEIISDDPDVFTVVEQMPEYSGGMDELITYLSNNIKYPIEAKEKGIQGKVFVSFIVDTDGGVIKAKVIRGIGGGCDEEAVRVVSSMPNWIPGKQRGELVKVSYNIPINFVLDEKLSDTIYKVVEVMPEFPGGTKKLISYLGNNIKYPEEAKKNGVQGRVFVTFVVEKDGRVNEVGILRGIGSGCDKEALRVIKSMPKWSPGMYQEEPVRVQYNLPVKFALQ